MWQTMTTILGVSFSALTLAAFLIWVERRLLAVWQDRLGPNRVGPFGLLQVLADMIKIFTKRDWVPPFAHRVLFVLAPAVIIVSVLSAFAAIPFDSDLWVSDLNVGLLFVLGMSSLAVYSAVMGGVASGSKYSLLGALRAAGQMLAYEVFMALALAGVVIQAGSFSLREIVLAQQDLWFCVPQALGCLVFFVASLAESKRLPFDMPEAEAELVAGYHTEYSGMKFGMFFVGEYLGVILLSSLMVTFFFGGWLGPGDLGVVWFLLKTLIFICVFVLMRATLPRPRSDQLMAFAWKVLLPLSLINVLATGAVVLLWGSP
jgi:NADH-quinone oxidoreductase subunit H